VNDNAFKCFAFPRFLKHCLLFTVFFLISFSAVTARTSEYYYIYAHSEAKGVRERLRNQVAQLGGQLRHSLSDSEFVAFMPQEEAKKPA